MAAAYAALASLMHTIHEIQCHHASPISMDIQQVQSLTRNITFLQGFLESYVPPVSDDDESADPLVMRIADAAYAAEDVIESHIVDTIQLLNIFNLTRLYINFYKNLQRVIEEMDLIINKMAITSIDTAEKAVVPASSVVASSSTGPSIITTMIVGFEEATLQIMEKLTEPRPDRQVIPIVGMGGIGKTTLARNIYAHKHTKDRFDICAWATISQQYNTREIICEVFSQVTGKDKKQVCGTSEAELGSELHKCLFGRRFLIVLDDMWSIDAWDNIQHLFPNNNNGSRILVTTRLLELRSRLNNGYSHQVSFLDEASSWDLFSKTVFGEKNICPRELKKIGKKIVEGCRGLPLSIVVVGGLLKKMDATQLCWELIGSNLTSVVNLENNKQCLRLLRLSYNHLPVHVKPCFLYMGVFEEDAEIKVSTLVDLWISEGFLKLVNGESLETSGMSLLKDLVDRNLVLVSKLGSTGNIKSCKIHDLVRDLCLKEGQKDGFHHVIEQRSVICEHEFCGVLKCSNLRLLMTRHVYDSASSGCISTFIQPLFRHPIALQYVNLRHLTIRHVCEDMSSFSASFIWNLHTIIIFDIDFNIRFLDEIWKMPQLRHIEFANKYYSRLPNPPTVDDDGVIMENLHTLKGVRNFKCCEEVVKRIPNIKKLNIQFTGMMEIFLEEYCFVSNVQLLRKLESLSVTFTCLRGHLYLHNLSFPDSLKRLTLSFHKRYELEESILENMSSLPFLEKLRLMNAFFGTGKWEIVEGQFPRLKYLKLSSCSGLEHWTAAEEESFIFPCIEQIHLISLKELKNIPREIGNIETLQKI